MKFTKMHGIGNDYVYVNCFSEKVEHPSETAVRVSDRHFGIGSDGMILIKPSGTADFEMEMYNADGSLGAMCGNGIRCVAKYVYDYGLTDQTQISVATGSGIKYLDLTVENGKVAQVRVDMGAPVLEAERIPVRLEAARAEEGAEWPETARTEEDAEWPETARAEKSAEWPETAQVEKGAEWPETAQAAEDAEWPETAQVEKGAEWPETAQVAEGAEWPEAAGVREGSSAVVDCPIVAGGAVWRMTCVSMGNPHCVVCVDDVEGLEIEKIGPAFEHHPCFPDRVNTEFIRVLDRHTVQMRVWERGSGETWACGTGACAVAVACILNGWTEDDVTVKLRGGDLHIEWDREKNTVFMTGPAQTVFDGEIVL